VQRAGGHARKIAVSNGVKSAAKGDADIAAVLTKINIAENCNKK
jgi:hypothetical protein